MDPGFRRDDEEGVRRRISLLGSPRTTLSAPDRPSSLLVVVVEDVVGTESLDVLKVALRAHAEHGQAGHLGQLDDVLADAAYLLERYVGLDGFGIVIDETEILEG